MSEVRYVTLGPLQAGEGSRAALGLRLERGQDASPVVLVQAPEALSSSPQLLEQLRRETARACVLEHPHILRVHGLAALEGGHARVTEYADGETLRRVLERAGRLPPALAVRLLADVAMGVHYAHLAGNDDGTPLVHGDLRPETLMLGFDGVSKVTGYGALGVAPREPQGRRVRNRRRYCAPEQLLGGRDAVTMPSDVLLLGLVLFECLTGEHPFAKSKDLDAALLLEPLPSRPEHVPAALDAVLRRACAKRAGERYGSALALREALVAAAGPLAEPAELAAFLSRSFPADEPARAARRTLIAQGLAAHRQPEPREPLPQSALVGSPVELLPPPPPYAEVAHAAPPPAPSAAPSAAPAGARWSLVLVALAAVALGAAGLRQWRRESAAPAAGPSPRAPAADAGVQVQAPVDAGEQLAQLELFVEPAVDVWLGHTPLGRTPLEAPLPAGRHVLSLRNAALGISTARTVTVGTSGRVSQRVYLARGYVSLTAPEGATVRVDGKSHGSAPVGELALYEGRHHLVVDVAGARWQQDFRLEPNQRLRFTVAFEQPELRALSSEP